jgi:hypothetical protein
VCDRDGALEIRSQLTAHSLEVGPLEKSRPGRGFGQLVNHGQFANLVAFISQSQHTDERGELSVDGGGRHAGLQTVLDILLRQCPFDTRGSPSGEKRLERLESRVRFLQAALLRQEYRALQEVLKERTGGLTQNVVTVEAMEKFRSAVRKHLEQLADTGQTRFVYMPHQNNLPDTVLKKQVYSGDSVEPFEGQGLLYHLSRLLELVGLSILRCPYCTQVFLRARADAEHCSRSCQANAHARRQREAAKIEKGARKVRRGKAKLKKSSVSKV